MLNSGTTAHMTPHENTVHHQYSCDFIIAISDDSIITAKTKGVRKVRWKGADGPVTVSLTDTLVAPDAVMSLLSVPALAKKEIAVLFLLDKAILFDLKDNNTILGYVKPADDDLYYIKDNQDNFPVYINAENSTFRAFMAMETDRENTEYLSSESDESTVLSHDEGYDSEKSSIIEMDSENSSLKFIDIDTDTISENGECSSEEEFLKSKNIKSIENNLSSLKKNNSKNNNWNNNNFSM